MTTTTRLWSNLLKYLTIGVGVCLATLLGYAISFSLATLLWGTMAALLTFSPGEGGDTAGLAITMRVIAYIGVFLAFLGITSLRLLLAKYAKRRLFQSNTTRRINKTIVTISSVALNIVGGLQLVTAIVPAFSLGLSDWFQNASPSSGEILFLALYLVFAITVFSIIVIFPLIGGGLLSGLVGGLLGILAGIAIGTIGEKLFGAAQHTLQATPLSRP
jgi:hypothetical protein